MLGWLMGLIVACSVGIEAPATKEIPLFDSEGTPTAYIDTDDELTIYLWNGTPVAYLESKRDSFSIYGFNGEHLGWFEDGIIRDHRGLVVGFVEGAASILTKLEPIKGLQRLKPLKRLQRLEPLKPLSVDRWSATPLAIFLAAGRSG